MTTTAFDRSTFVTAVTAAIAAPSLHNSQPWRFRLCEDRVEVLADDRRALPSADPSGWGLRLACGAATFNLRLAFAVLGAPMEVRWRPTPADPSVMAALTPGPARPATPVEERLYRAIPLRHSNRSPFFSRAVPAEARARLIEAAQAELAWLELVTGVAAVEAVAEIAQAANRVLNRNPEYVAEVAAWTRADDAGEPVRPDGVPVSAGGPNAEPQDLFPQRPFGDHPRSPGHDFEPEPLVGILGTAGDLASDQLTAGQALQRVLLTVTDLGLAASMLSQPIEVASAREQLRLALGRYGTPQMVLRIGYGQPAPGTARRSVEDCLEVAQKH
jgi:nitroreductase